MTANKDDIQAKIDEYHLMVEEVLGGMDMMVSKLEARIQYLEKTLGIDTKDSQETDDNRIVMLGKELADLRSEVTEGLKLAFRKIAENND